MITTLGVKMKIVECAIPDKSYANWPSIMMEFVEKEISSKRAKLLLRLQPGSLFNRKRANQLMIVLPSQYEVLKSDIQRESVRGMNLFVFTVSHAKESTTFFKNHGYSEQNICTLDDIPVQGKLLENVTDIMSNISWQESVVFSYHDGNPIYVIA